MNEAKQVSTGCVQFFTDRIVELGYQRVLEGDDKIAQVATLERRGGPCPLCGREFQVVHVDNIAGKFDYYEPSCRCYKRCEVVTLPSGNTVNGCGRFMIAERSLSYRHCISCYDTRWDDATTATKANVVANRGRVRE